VSKTQDCWSEAELYRLKGELLLMQDESSTVEAKGCFQHAIGVARGQCAKSCELRATLSLVRLLAKQGRCDEAHTMLAEIYNWFTEGFDTPTSKTPSHCWKSWERRKARRRRAMRIQHTLMRYKRTDPRDLLSVFRRL
jgi:hypothetical protein